MVFRHCLWIHLFLCGTSNGTVGRNNRAKIRQLVILPNCLAHKTVVVQLLRENARNSQTISFNFLLDFNIVCCYCWWNVAHQQRLFFPLFQRDNSSCVGETKEPHNLAAKTFKSSSHLHRHQLLSQYASHWKNINKGVESERVMDEGVEERKSPDGTVKRIHNGNTTLAPFSVLMQACTSITVQMESVALRRRNISWRGPKGGVYLHMHIV